MTQFPGSYPGGPSRRGDGERRARPRLESAEELESRMGWDAHRRRQRHRTRRVWVGMAVALVLAGGTGLYLGMRTTRTSEELTAEQASQRRRQDSDLTSETNRILLELWKMEDLEGRAGGPR